MSTNNNIDENDLETTKEVVMAKKRKRKLTRDQQKAMFAKGNFGTRRTTKTYRRLYSDSDFNPNKSFPKDLKIKVPTTSPTLNIKKVDIAIDNIFKKKKKG